MREIIPRQNGPKETSVSHEESDRGEEEEESRGGTRDKKKAENKTGEISESGTGRCASAGDKCANEECTGSDSGGGGGATA